MTECSLDGLTEPSVEVLLVDFGNVIGFFDHRITCRRLAEFSPFSEEELYQRIFASGLELGYEEGRLSTDEVVARVREECQLTCTDPVIRRAAADIFWPNEEVCALVPKLAEHYPLILASNTNELHAEQFRKQFADVLGRFRDLVLSYEVGYCKPAEGFFRACLRVAGCPAERCVFIDDIPSHVESASRLGLHAVRYESGAQLRARLGELGIHVPD